MEKKLNLLFKILFSIFIFSGVFLTTPANAEEKPPNINAKAAVVLDGETGQILYSKDCDNQYFPASTTKVLTALVVLDNTNLNDIITIGMNPPFADGSSIGLKEGEKFTVETLLTGLLLESGNDCAEALAEHVGGSLENFANMMNEKAKAIGCKNSKFNNPSGLPDDKHLTTAYDLALILREAIKNPDFVRISRLISVELPPSNLDKQKRWANNHNHLINKNSKYFYKYALAGKSGYTDVAKHTFVISAEKNGRTLVGAFLKAEDKNKNFEDMKKVLEYCFDNFQNVKLYSKDDLIETVEINKNISLPILINKDVNYSFPKDIASSVKPSINYELPHNIKRMDIKKGEKLATGKVIANGEVVETIDLISGINREYNSKIALNEFLSKHSLIVIIIISILILIIFILIRIRIVKKRREKKAFDKKWGHLRNKYKK